jgi:hypothetical protein
LKLRELLGISRPLINGFYNDTLQIISDQLSLDGSPFDELNKKQQLYLFLKCLFLSVQRTLEPEYIVDFAECAARGMREWLRYHDAFTDRRDGRPLSQCLDEEIKKITRSALRSAERDKKRIELSDEEFMRWIGAKAEKDTGIS